MEIYINTHEFEKQNTVTIFRGKKAYDRVKCKVCGLEGIRNGLLNMISVKRDKKCAVKQRQLVQVISKYAQSEFGFYASKYYNRVECPDSEKARFANDVWIFSDTRNKPVRLLAGEYILIAETPCEQ